MWVIKKDHISGESGTNVGVGSRDFNKDRFYSGHFHVEFRLYDDDDILYYEGLMTKDRFEEGDESQVFEPLDWAMANDGCTYMTVYNKKTGIWEQV